MSSTIATFEAVTAAVNDLRQASTGPAGEAITKHLGGGSKRTVLDHLRTLRRANATSEMELSHGIVDIVRPCIAEAYEAGVAVEAERNWARTDRQSRLMDEMGARILELDTDNNRLRGFAAVERTASQLAWMEEHLKACAEEFETWRSEVGWDRDANLVELVASTEQAVKTPSPTSLPPSTRRAAATLSESATDGLFDSGRTDNE